jgi:mitogen-activated protein kinase kinase
MDRDNRKSHLAPQLSPATQDLLRASDSPLADDRTLQTPTSGEIPIVGHLVSPRDQYLSISNRSPTRNGTVGSGRPGGTPVHPGLGQRVVTTNSIPKSGGLQSLGAISGPRSASEATFTLPVRPGPPSGPLPPPPIRKDTIDEIKKDNRRQATFGPPMNGSFGLDYSAQ